MGLRDDDGTGVVEDARDGRAVADDDDDDAAAVEK